MEWLGYIVIICMLAFIMFGIPVAVSLGIWGFIGFAIYQGPDVALNMLAISSFRTLYNFVFACIPLFILMAEIIMHSRLNEDLFEAMYNWFGGFPAGLAVAGTAACAVFGAMSGSTVAASVTVGSVAIPEMRKRKYADSLSMGSIASSGTLASLIPPSITFILYAIVTEQSVGKLFIAGVVPGIMLSILYIIYEIAFGIRHPDQAPRSTKVSWSLKIASLRKTWPLTTIIVIILGSIYTGIATPTEAAAVGAFVALILAVAKRKLNLRGLWSALGGTIGTSGFMMIIVVGALYFGYFITAIGLPQKVMVFVTSLPVSPWAVMVFINIMLLILGCFLDTASIVLITSPFLYPIIMKLGFDPIWFGVILVINMEMGLVTPPVGMNLYIVKGMFPDVEIGTIIRGIIPFVFIDMVAIAILMLFPQLALWLPNLMMQ